MDTLELLTFLQRHAARYRTILSEMELDLYCEELAPYDRATLAAAFAWCSNTNPKFFPTLPELSAALRSMARAAGNTLDGAGAWAAFESRVLGRYSFGITKAFDWPDDLTRSIVREQLGFDSAAVHNLAMIDNDIQRDKYRKRFIALYDEQRGLAEAQAAAVLAAGDVLRLGRGE